MLKEQQTVRQAEIRTPDITFPFPEMTAWQFIALAIVVGLVILGVYYFKSKGDDR